VLRPLRDLRIGDRVEGTIISYEPWGIIAKLRNVEAVGASLDMIRRRGEPGVQALAEHRPSIGTTVEFVIGELRPWHQEPWMWVDLATLPDPAEVDGSET
jgi:hypothetical protein